MPLYTITIELDNAAFGDGNEGQEVARILQALARDCASQEEVVKLTLRDYNGNHVGHADRIT